jgi:hypothetical protein
MTENAEVRLHQVTALLVLLKVIGVVNLTVFVLTVKVVFLIVNGTVIVV